MVMAFVWLTVGATGCSWIGEKFGHKKTVDGSTLPKMAQYALSDHWKSWAPAELDPQAVSCAGSSAPTLTVTADLDGDGQDDVSTAVKTPDGVQLVALLRRGEEYKVIEIEPFGTTQASASLGLEKRGARFENPVDLTYDFYAANTLATYRCGKPTAAYIWSGLVFKKVALTK
jgi:hypothetical protein